MDLMSWQGGKMTVAETCGRSSLCLRASGGRGFVTTGSRYQFQHPPLCSPPLCPAATRERREDVVAGHEAARDRSRKQPVTLHLSLDSEGTGGWYSACLSFYTLAWISALGRCHPYLDLVCSVHPFW